MENKQEVYINQQLLEEKRSTQKNHQNLILFSFLYNMASFYTLLNLENEKPPLILTFIFGLLNSILSITTLSKIINQHRYINKLNQKIIAHEKSFNIIEKSFIQQKSNTTFFIGSIIFNSLCILWWNLLIIAAIGEMFQKSF